MLKYGLNNAEVPNKIMKKEGKLNLFDIIVYAMMVVAVGYIIIQTILGNNSELSFKITLGIWVLAAVIVSDFVEPMATKVLDNISFKRGLYYVMYSIFDASSYISFYIFIINIGLTKEILHYVFLGLAIIFFIARILLHTMYENCESESDDEELENLDDIEVNTLDASDTAISHVVKNDDDDMKVLIYRSRNK